jgi:hypothetical protein
LKRDFSARIGFYLLVFEALVPSGASQPKGKDMAKKAKKAKAKKARKKK